MSVLLLFSLQISMSAQTTTTSSTGTHSTVKITTKVRPIASLSDQVKDLEQKVEMAKKDPILIENGTLAKYEQALVQRRRQLEEENAVRTAPTQKLSK